jgi:hypothetical protein
MARFSKSAATRSTKSIETYPSVFPDTTLGEIRKETGKISETAVRRAAAKLAKK